MGYAIRTLGGLMDFANMKGNDALKSKLREHFRTWCEENGLEADAFNSDTVIHWRMQRPSGTKEDAELIMLAFGFGGMKGGCDV